MILHYLLLLKRLWFNKARHYIINMVGLAAGVSGCLLVGIYCYFEFSFDAFHQDAARIYRLQLHQSRTPVPLVPAIQASIPDVEASTRLIFTTSGTKAIVKDSSGELYEEDLYFADSTFFHIFSFPAISGSLKNPFTHIQNVVITKEVALKYFKSTEVVGKELELANAFFREKIFKVAAVIENIPPNSQLQFDILISYQLHGTFRNESWAEGNVLSFVKIKPGKEEAVLDQVRTLYTTHSTVSKEVLSNLALVPLTALHFVQTTSFDFPVRAKKENLWILLTVGLLMGTIAFINYINLSSVSSLERMKEVMVRKTLGASKFQLLFRFLSESMAMTVLSFCLAGILVYLVMPYANLFFGIDFIYAHNLFIDTYWYYLPIVALALGLIGGLYPFQIVSGLRTHNMVRNVSHSGRKFRTTVVALQFGVTTFFVCGTLIVYQQMKYLQSKDLGFNQEQLMVLNVGGPGVGNQLESIRTEFMKHPMVESVSASLTVPGDNVYRIQYVNPAHDQTNPGDCAILYADPQLPINLNLKFISGNSFSGNPGTDTTSIVLNQSAVGQLVSQYGEEWADPIGKTINLGALMDGTWFNERDVVIVGVVEDFNYSSLHNKIGPMAILVNPDLYFKLLVRMGNGDVVATTDFLKKKWNELNMNRPFVYDFLDQRFNLAYKKDKSFESIFMLFATLSILIGVFGLYSLVLFVVQIKQKEISMRKVLGAKVEQIALFISQYFYKPIGIGFLCILPLAYYLMEKWLNQFAYKISISVFMLVVPAAIVFSIATLTMLSKTISVSRSNPADYLRD